MSRLPCDGATIVKWRAAMTKRTAWLAALALVLACGVQTAPAQAQLSRTFVSAASGNDANNCDRPTPCRTFQGAHDKTNDQGEITVLDPGGYGGVTITKSISIVNDSVGEASTLVSGGATGITVSGGPGTYVNLRGITVQGIGFGGGTGLVFTGGFSLTITNGVFRNLTGHGVVFGPTVAGPANLSVSDTIVADNGNIGIFVVPHANVTARVVIDAVKLLNNSNDGLAVDGQIATGTINASVTNSVSANNGGTGFSVFSSANTAKSSLTLIRSVAANNKLIGVGVLSLANASLWVGQSSITGNPTSWSAPNGNGTPLLSFGDNYIAGNGDGDPAPPTIARK
jgi:hypothetical protein